MSEHVEVVVGVIGRPHGVRGEVAVDVRTDELERRFTPGTMLRAEDTSATFTVAGARDHSGRLLVRFVELADRNAVEAVRGLVLLADVPVQERPSEPEEYYDRQLVGLQVITEAGATVGSVSAVLHLGVQDVLEVGTDSGPRLVPFVTALVPEVDLAAGRLTVVDTPGLLAEQE